MNMIEGHRQIVPPAGVPSWDVDPFTPEVLSDPVPYFADLRARGELVFLPRYSVLAVGRYQITHDVFSDHENFVSSRGVGLSDFKLDSPWRKPSIILEVDPPEHTRTRKVMSRALSPKVVRDFSDLFRETAERLVDKALEMGTIEAVTEFAEAYPTTVFPAAVGMRDTNPRFLVDYGAMVFNAVGPDNEIRRNSMSRESEIVPWITDACARDRLTEDGLGARIYAEAAMLVRSLLSAGVDTTVTGIGSALWCLSRNPGEWERLKEDPKLVRPAFDEVLRYTSPVHTFFRTAGRDTEIAGFPVEEGSKILCALGAANLDPEKWDEPDVFRVDRRPKGHLAFGAGIHGCVGQNVARGELAAVLQALIEKVLRIEPAGEAEWRPNNSIHALDKLPLRLIAN